MFYLLGFSVVMAILEIKPGCSEETELNKMKKKHHTGKKRKSGFLLFSLIILSIIQNNKGYTQNTIPDHYWTFEGSNALKDSLSGTTLNVNAYNCIYKIDATQNSGVGNSMNLGSDGKIIVISQFNLDKAMTVEFLFKPGHDFNTTQFFSRRDNAFSIKMGYPFIQFYTNIISPTGSTISDNMNVDLLGIGRLTYGYYTDGNWHHLVFKYDTNTGIKEIWVDGELADGFSTTTATGSFNTNATNLSNNDVLINTNTSYYKFKGNLDEIAIYTSALSANNIYNHYKNANQHHHYSFTNSTLSPPNPAAVSAGINLNEYAPGHPIYSKNAIEQLTNFPLPRYKTNHSLLPNFNWMAIRYMSGEFQQGVSYAQAVSNSVELQQELAKNWNYYLMVSGNTGTSGQYNDITKYHGAWVKLANANPQWPTSAISFWSQLNPSAYGFTSKTGYIENKTLPDNHYLKNSAGQFLDLSGQAGMRKFWSPSAPIDSFINDGLTQRGQLLRLLSALTRPLNMISENAEVIPKMQPSVMAMDPEIVNDKDASGISDWDTYLANRKARTCLAYRDHFMNLPQLANTKYSEYQISGHPKTRHKYSETRIVNTTVNNQHYATPDFYPRWPKNWQTGTGAWNGWQHIIDGRYYEIQAGDKLFSPFVAAGWNEDEERNIRPAQWLGLLKCMGMLGAEYYYTGFFNEASSYQPPNPPPANPAGYIWQVSIPSYAQAITSRYEDILRNGDLMPGDKPNSYSNPTAPGYSFEAGDARKLVVIRKHHSENVYAITGTIQPNSNMSGNSEIESDALITLEGNKIQFKIRRQGSTYIFDNKNQASPVFYQLDGWHEANHPFVWSKDFDLEAELMDNASTAFKVATEKVAGSAPGDFRDATSYISFISTAVPLEYNFEPRSNTNLYLWVRARSVKGITTGFSVSINGLNQKSIGCIVDTAWKWYCIDACTNQPIVYNTLANSQKLILSAVNNSIEIDKILLTPNSSLQLNNNQPSCSGLMSTIVAWGPTGLCIGDSVKLTASAGATYLWSNGKTSQSIYVTNSGSYSVTVANNNNCSGTSVPVIVTVTNKPDTTVTASGPTNICKGGSVNLTAATASSYFWSNGETTKTIHVDSSGNYLVTVSNINGCSAISSGTNVSVYNLPIVTVTPGGPIQLMTGQNVTLTANGGTTYLWNPGGATTASIVVSSAGNYQVTATTSGGCSAKSDTIKVTVNNQLTANITIVGNQYLCPGDTLTLMSDYAYAYSWSPGGATTRSIKVSQAGAYKLKIFDALGNSVSKIIDVTSAPQPPTPSISINYIPNAAYQLTANTPSAASYLWSNGESTSTISVTVPAIYSVVAISPFGCTSANASMNIGSVTGQPCSTPDMLTSFDIIDTAATIGWNPAVTGDAFKLSYWIDGSTDEKTITLPGNVSSYRISKLQPGSTYRWKIQMICLNLQKTSNVEVFTTMSSALPCGSIPSNLSATNITINQAQLNWYKTTATNFQIRYRPTGTTSYSYITFDGSLNSQGGLLTNLAKNTMYEWSIQSKCNGITTAYSKSSFFTTIDPCGYMGNTSVNLIAPCSATINWDNMASMDTIRIRITNAVTGTVRNIYINGINNTGHYVLRQLKPNTNYLVDVKGKCSTSTAGSWTSKIPFTTASLSSKESEQNPFQLSGYPNPTSDILSYTFSSEKKEDYLLRVCDMSGRELFQEARSAEDGSNGDMIDVKKYPTGLYLLILQKGTQTSHFRFAVD